MSDDKIVMVKQIVDKKYTKANDIVHDMLKNKAFDAINNFKTGFKYVTTKAVDTTETPTEQPKEA